MANAELAYINHEVLQWAVDRSGALLSDIAKRLNVSEQQINGWIEGIAAPPFNKAIKLAGIVRIPFGFLFLSRPPEVTTPIPDLRTLPQFGQQEPSVNFLDLLHQVMARQEWYREFTIEQGARPLPFVSSFQANGVKPVASDARQTLRLTPEVRRNARDWEGYLSLLCDRAESAGILVMRSSIVGNNTRRPLSVTEFQGFAITDDVAPLVFINSKDYKTAQIFTLAHELAHIWIGQSGISKADETGDSVQRIPNVEAFCNAVAAEMLVPEDEFNSAITRPLNLQRLATHFWVSTLVVLRRARDLGKISPNEFYGLLGEERKKIQATVKKAGGGTFYRNVDARFGTRFPEALIQDVKRGGTPYRDAASLLAVKVPTVKKLTEQVG